MKLGTDVGQDLVQMVGERRSAQSTKDDWQRRTSHWQAWHQRISDFDAIARGEFHIVFPDETSVVERPKVPNIVQLKIDDLSQIAVHAVHSIRCDATSEKAKPKAAKRERIAAWYALCNRTELMRPQYIIDTATTGASFRIVLPDFNKGYPVIRRVDPRYAFPDSTFTHDRGMQNLVVAYKQTRAQLCAEFQDVPEILSRLNQNANGGEALQLDVLEYYDSSELIRIAIVPGRSKSETHTLELSRAPNLLSRPPIAVATRPTHDQELRGVFDQMLGVLNAENRVQNLLIDAAADWISSPIVEFDIENPDDWGTGKVIHKKSKEGSMGRATPAMANPAVFNVLNEMKGDSRAAAAYPEARSGIARQSIVSAAGMNTLSGTFDSEVAALLKMDAAATAEAFSLCLEVDDKYFAKEKRYIQGSVNGKSFAESYTPSEDIKGEYRVRIEVPGAGEDPFNREIRLTQQHNNGLVSKRTVMEQLTSVKEVLKEEKLLVQEALLQAGLAYILAQAANIQKPNFAPAAALIKALDAPDANLLLVLAQFGDIQQGQAPGGVEGDAFAEANALSRGGVSSPGNVPGLGEGPPSLEQKPSTGTQTIGRPGLPPLSTLMVRG